jgi:hypothetical protein
MSRSCRVCTCSLCISSGEFASDVTGQKIPGRLVGYNEYLHHLRNDISTGEVGGLETVIEGVLEAPEDVYGAPGDALSLIVQELDFRAQNFKQGSKNLVFDCPPDLSANAILATACPIEPVPNDGPLPLQHHLHNNAAFLDYQTWLLEAYSIVAAVSTEGVDSRVTERKNRLMKALMKEIKELERVKASELRCQMALQSIAHSYQKSGVPHVDTSES